MAIDTYAPCPGATGKKIKFCCADLIGDLEQLDTLVEGDQVSAALDQVRRLDEKHPGRACLLATRTKLELATKQYAEAAASSRAFLDAFPDNPLAMGQAAVTDVIAGRVQEAAAAFDRARAAAAGTDATEELVRIAATLVQGAAQLGHVGFAQGLVDWLGDANLGTSEERRLLAAIVGSSGVPPALRTRVRLAPTDADTAWRPDFDAALEHARHWRLSKALTAFRSLRGVAGESRELFTDIAVICEMLARPVEASEAWLVLAGLRDTPPDEAIEATGRAMALETEADPDRSPVVRFVSRIAPLQVPGGEAGSNAIDLLEDRLRHAGRFESAPFDRSQWVARGMPPPRSAWRTYDDGRPARLLATLLIFGRQTDREPEAVLQGFAPDVDLARPAVESALSCGFGAETSADAASAVTPTTWLLASQFRTPPLPAAPSPAAAGEPAVIDTVLAEQRTAVCERFLQAWPDTPLPELLGATPRDAVRDPRAARRLEALVAEGEATSRRPGLADAWTLMRGRLGLRAPPPVESTRPFDDGVPPLRWHRLDMRQLAIDDLRGVLVTAADAGFERAAVLAAEALASRPDATPADRWEALGILEERAESTVRRLGIIAELRGLARQLKASDGMLDVAELRVRLQRGEQAETVRLLDRVRREHGRDPQVIQALAEVLMEAGIDLQSLAARGPAAAAGAGGGAMPAQPAAEQAGRIWTPGAEAAPAAGGEKKVIWTPN